MSFSQERVGEYLAALSRLRDETNRRVELFTSGCCHVHQNGRDVTGDLVRAMRGEVAQIEWLVEQIAKGCDGETAEARRAAN